MPAHAFFSIPELVFEVLAYLDRRSLLAFTLVSRQYHQLSYPFLNRDLAIWDDATLVLLLNNVSTLKTITKHTHQIRSLRTGAPFLAAYMNGLALQSQLSSLALSASPSGPIITAPN
ncbi:hypothetical protein BG015_011504 [Linnemannia schmuckeri]|uniref:F-box domain-containing protein n=1 Tax=Linnemannia schmuckeri TaxID=64567 RepID=A0A9P5RV01_9FUNG|nr:hypothetical protein BG015_011504 [Linnemannia schmuckeri]